MMRQDMSCTATPCTRLFTAWYDSHVEPRPSMSSSLSSASLLNCSEATASGMCAFVKCCAHIGRCLHHTARYENPSAHLVFMG